MNRQEREEIAELVTVTVRRELRGIRRLLWTILGKEGQELRELEEIEDKIGKEGQRPAPTIDVRLIGPVVSRDTPASWRTNDMAFQLRDGERVTLAIDPRDVDGNPAVIDGVPSWTSSDPALIMVTPNPSDPKQADAATVPAAVLGRVTVSVTVDADLGAGVTNITGSLDIEKVAGDAMVVNVTPGAPSPR